MTSAGDYSLLRLISRDERPTSIIMLSSAYQLTISGVLMLGGFVAPSLADFGKLAIAGGLSGAGQLLVIRAMQRAPASQIGPTNYVQILWGVGPGAAIYGESRDAVGYTGLALIVVAGVATVFSDGAGAQAKPPAAD